MWRSYIGWCVLSHRSGGNARIFCSGVELVGSEWQSVVEPDPKPDASAPSARAEPAELGWPGHGKTNDDFPEG